VVFLWKNLEINALNLRLLKTTLAWRPIRIYKQFMQTNTESVKKWFETELHVSRETLSHLEHYADLVVKWQPSINIVGASTAEDVWARHLQDSAQIWPHLADIAQKPDAKIIDFGSGAGFPGVVLSILGASHVTMMESVTKKTVFLSEACRVCGCLGKTRVARERIESAKPENADIITARAFAPLPKLLEMGQRHLKPGGKYVLLKGRAFESELADARDAGWRFSVTTFPGLVDPEGVVMILEGVVR
tara:strand:+ start:104619 stop:105359 length:741 start_codon:yes stop_codon:yes gene_type:complete